MFVRRSVMRTVAGAIDEVARRRGYVVLEAEMRDLDRSFGAHTVDR